MKSATISAVEVHDFAPERTQMRAEVLAGLARTPKCLPSHYLYDERGSLLFDEICELPEYYLTRTEIGILERCMPAIVRAIGPEALVLEPGSGSGVKTRLLLEHLIRPAGYVPIEIAREHLENSVRELQAAFPALHVIPVCADFTGDFDVPPNDAPVKKRVLFFPGSTIGNFTPTDAVALLRRMAKLCRPGGGVLIGVDTKKSRAMLEAAYDDAAGVSARFALNYLVRLNRELGADFDLAQFDYEAPYSAKLGRIEMALVSRRAQSVHLDGKTVSLAAGERIRTEYAYKYHPHEFAGLAARAGMLRTHLWTDEDELFSLHYLAVQPYAG